MILLNRIGKEVCFHVVGKQRPTDIRGVLWPSWGVGKFVGEIPDPNSALGTMPVNSSCQSKHNDFNLSTV